MGAIKNQIMPKDTLYDRLGGDPFLNMLTCAFFDELVENPDLKPFFKHISKSALKCHQVKLFRVIFGPDEEKPKDEDLLDFMLRTHTRLFRELGLAANHFDLVATCFVQGLETFQIDQGLIDECVAILMPLRAVFEYGAVVAAREKEMTLEERSTLPAASPIHIGTDAPVVLPEYSKIEVPEWLPPLLVKVSSNGQQSSLRKSTVVRAWTCDLTDRFGAEGDVAIADTFMDQPYMDHHVYLVAFLQLAFLPEDHVEYSPLSSVLGIVLYPRGPNNAPLSQELYDRMITQFLFTCHKMGVSNFDAKAAEKKLRSYRSTFAETTTVVGGINAHHILLKVTKKNKNKTRKTKSSKSKRGLLGKKKRSSHHSKGSATKTRESFTSETSRASETSQTHDRSSYSLFDEDAESSFASSHASKSIFGGTKGLRKWSIFSWAFKAKAHKKNRGSLPTTLEVPHEITAASGY